MPDLLHEAVETGARLDTIIVRSEDRRCLTTNIPCINVEYIALHSTFRRATDRDEPHRHGHFKLMEEQHREEYRQDGDLQAFGFLT